MTHENKTRRIKWGVKRREGGWLPVVYVGESPVTFGPPMDKAAARMIARRRAAEFRFNTGA